MATIKGRVIDYDTDNSILGVLVEGVAPNGTVFASGTSDGGGSFSVNHTGFDDLYSKIRFSKTGYATQTMRPASAMDTDVVLPKANTLAAVTLTVKQNKTKVVLFLVIGAAIAYLFIKYRSQIKL